uniref:Uncharacterized protein n=1 Tax=Acrobeloides nanus TaxID=290746 RepID=A0A914EMV7_9BILA
MKFVCVFLLKVLLVKSEWEIPDELLPPKILAEIVGGFSPFVGYFSALGSSTHEWLQSYAQNSDPTLFTYIMQPSTQPFTRTNIGMEEGPTCDLRLGSNSDLRLTFPDEHGKCVQSNVLTNVKLNVNLTTFCWMLCSDVAERCFSNRNSSQQLCICENCQDIK